MSDEIPEKKAEIGGWLVLVGIFIWLGAIGGLFSTLSSAMSLTSHPIDFVLQALAWICCLIILVMFHQRKRQFVKWTLIYESLIFVRECYHMYLNLAFHVQSVAGGTAVVIGVFVVAFIEILLVVLYVIRSNRVQQTFTR